MLNFFYPNYRDQLKKMDPEKYGSIEKEDKKQNSPQRKTVKMEN